MSLSLRTCLTLVTAAVISSAMSSKVVLGQAEQSQVLKVITHNVWYGFTKKTEPRHGEWKQWMARQSPDVVSLQELNGFSANDLAEDAASWGHSYSEILKKAGSRQASHPDIQFQMCIEFRKGFTMASCDVRFEVCGFTWFIFIHQTIRNASRKHACSSRTS